MEEGEKKRESGREREGGAEKAFHHQEPYPRRQEVYILGAPSLSLILLESTTQQKNLLTATTQPLSSRQVSMFFLVSTF